MTGRFTMLGGTSITKRRRLLNHLRYRCRRWSDRFRYRSPLFYRRLALFLAALVLAAVEVSTGQIVDGIAAFAVQGKPNRVPCYRWPTVEKIERVLEEHAELVAQIEAVEPGGSRVVIRSWGYGFHLLRCPGKGILDISYPGYREMRAIKSIIGDRKYFLGVPYAMWSY